jgi:hypothetical protein
MVITLRTYELLLTLLSGMVVVKLAKFDCIQAGVILHPGPITVDEINGNHCISSSLNI